jgi:putative two-component system response regulator
MPKTLSAANINLSTGKRAERTLEEVASLLARLDESSPAVPCPPESARILIVDDEPVNIKVIQKYLLEFGYCQTVGISDSRLAIDAIVREQPDVLLLDVLMPHVSGIDVLTRIRSRPELSQLPVIVLTAASDRETKIAVFDRGATDFLSKPVDVCELIPRVRNAVTQKRCHDQLQNYARHLEDAVRRRTAELEASRKEVIYCLARAAELRDDDTGHHVLRVGKYAAIIGRALGLSSVDVEVLEQAAQLHDIGKIGIPDEILLKPGQLTPAQTEQMKKHAALGKQIIEPMPVADFPVRVGDSTLRLRPPTNPVLQVAARIALTHHERWDGSGYPLGLAGDDIPLEGRITAVADVYDALASKRPYKPAIPSDECFSLIQEGSGTQFDPRVVEVFLACRQEVADVQLQFADLG